MNKLVISLFDGMSCGQLSISSFTKDYTYYSSEIEKQPIMVTQHNFPNTIQLGDVSKINTNTFKQKPFILFGGSPCTDFSMNGNMNGMVTKDNIVITSLDQYLSLKNKGTEFEGESYLFWEFVRILKETKPEYFLLENVLFKGKMKKYEQIITDVLGVQPIVINSNLVSGQNRERIYWTNIPNVTQPEDKGITIHDIITDCLGGYGERGVLSGDPLNPYNKTVGTIRPDKKSNCLVTGGRTNKVKMSDGTIRHYTIEEREKLQTLPVGYTNVPGVNKTSKIKMIGNGWTIDVIKHIMSFIPEFQHNVLQKAS